MTGIILLIALLIVFVMLVIMTYYLRTIKLQFDETDEEKEDIGMEKKGQGILASQNFVYTAIVLTAVGMLVAVYLYVKGTAWESHLMEWMNIVVRLMHITFGIAWIGASFYFVFLENALNRTVGLRDELAGNLWAVHGGGFYYLEKYKTAPEKFPKHLHWFKYEAYFTWLSGFCLMFVVYYFNASALLIDKNVLNISPLAGIGIGLGSFLMAWLLYDLLCKTPLVTRSTWFAFAGFIISVGFAYFYCSVFSARAAYIHFGAMIGSIMAANVFFVIIPSQKAMVNAAKEGVALNPQLGKNALTRSIHNNYFTLPVLFVMISNHFPSTFGSAHPWLVLSVISLGAAGVKHYLNLREKGQLTVWVMPVSALILLAAAFISAPPKDLGACTEKVSVEEVVAIINNRCISCHSSRPTDEVYMAPPNGVIYDTPEDIVKKKDLIMQRVVITKTMPLNNKTNMTQRERDQIRCWIAGGRSGDK